MTNQIRQQESAIEMLRMMVQSNRAAPSKLEAAINELNRLESELAVSQNAKPADPQKKAPVRMTAKVASIMADVNSDMVTVKKSGLLQEISRLSKDRADLSNMLHKVPHGQPCPELTGKILDIHKTIESLWDQQKFLERNGSDGPVNPSHDQQIVPRTLEKINTKAELSVELQKLREKKSKLKKKLLDPKVGIEKRSEWEQAIAQVDAEIEEATTKRALI